MSIFFLSCENIRVLKILQGKRFGLENALTILFLWDPSAPPFNLYTLSASRLCGGCQSLVLVQHSPTTTFPLLFIPSWQFRASKSRSTSNKGRLQSPCCSRSLAWENWMILLRILRLWERTRVQPRTLQPLPSWMPLQRHLLQCDSSLFKSLDKAVPLLWTCHEDKERITSLTHEITLPMRF